MKKELMIINLWLGFITGCADVYHINPIETQNVYVNDYSIPAINKNLVISTPLTQPKQIVPIKKSPAIINFIGAVTLKKSNELTSYIHKQWVDGVTEFIINLNSSGGDTDAGISAYQYLKTLPISITTYNTSNVQSAAALIYCAGQKRYALPNSFFMLHGNSTTYNGSMSLLNIEAIHKLSKIRLKAFTEIFKNCTELDAKTAENYFSSSITVYFTAEEAKEIGLVAEIGAPKFAQNVTIYNITD